VNPSDELGPCLSTSTEPTSDKVSIAAFITADDAFAGTITLVLEWIGVETLTVSTSKLGVNATVLPVIDVTVKYSLFPTSL
jgi:hypothetical protein